MVELFLLQGTCLSVLLLEGGQLAALLEGDVDLTLLHLPLGLTLGLLNGSVQVL